MVEVIGFGVVRFIESVVNGGDFVEWDLVCVVNEVAGGIADGENFVGG